MNILSISFDWFEFSFSKFQKNKFNIIIIHIDSRNLVGVVALSESMAIFLDLVAPFLEGEQK